jgi:hypothetical protein
MLYFCFFSTLYRLPLRSPSTSSSSPRRTVPADPILRRGVHRRGQRRRVGSVPPPPLPPPPIHHPQSNPHPFSALTQQHGLEWRCAGGALPWELPQGGGVEARGGAQGGGRRWPWWSNSSPCSSHGAARCCSCRGLILAREKKGLHKGEEARASAQRMG